MKLEERALHYYSEKNLGCGEAILRAANEVYGMGLSDAACGLFAGFRTGMGCGSTCGSLIGAIGVLSQRYGDREDCKALSAAFLQEFEAAIGCGSLDCAVIAPKYKTAAARCAGAVAATARLLEDFIDRQEGKNRPTATELLPAAEIKRLKSLGCLWDKRYHDLFNVRIITRNGKITAREQHAIAEAAERFGSGEVTMTTRLTVEIQGVPHRNMEELFSFLHQNQLETGGTGSLVRPVVSCKGTTCQYGLIDTYDLSEKLHRRFYEGYHNITLPHKFKIAVGGCPNNCVKPELNDLGIVGQRVPVLNLEKCRGCAVCQVEKGCPIHISKLENGKLFIDPEGCNHCGRCQGKCPFGAIDGYTDGYRVYIGGRWGKRTAHGIPLSKIFTSEEELMTLVEDAILLFRSEGIPGERFSDTIARLGFETVEKKLLGHELDKQAILGKDVVGGATC